jgi:hypothetical protein
MTMVCFCVFEKMQGTTKTFSREKTVFFFLLVEDIKKKSRRETEGGQREEEEKEGKRARGAREHSGPWLIYREGEPTGCGRGRANQ